MTGDKAPSDTYVMVGANLAGAKAAEALSHGYATPGDSDRIMHRGDLDSGSFVSSLVGWESPHGGHERQRLGRERTIQQLIRSDGAA